MEGEISSAVPGSTTGIVTKDWKYTERHDAQFRAEFFNVLNHANFANSGGIGSGAGFNDRSTGASGQFGCGCVTPYQAAPNPVLGAGGARSLQLGLKLLFRSSRL